MAHANGANRLPVVDLFAGAGGSALGAKAAGCDTRLLVELDPTCCATLRGNREFREATVLNADVSTLKGQVLRKLSGLSKADPLLIVGGAPCQPFSKAAYWTDPGEDSHFRRARARGERVQRPIVDLGPRADSRRTLVKDFVRLVIEAKATGFVFENVTSILHPRNRGLVSDLIRHLEKARYYVTLVRANAAEHGVPQTRQRVFLLGHRRHKPVAPSHTHTLDSDSSGGLPQAITTGQALRGFDTPDLFEPEEIVTGRWARHLSEIPPGWNYKWHTAWAGHENPSFETETRFWTFLLKLAPNRPSWTIAASPGPWVGPFHWNGRRLRMPELAALQGFPRHFKFCGSRRDKIRQIGNAVPPNLGAAMIKSVAAAEYAVLRKRRPAVHSRGASTVAC